MNDDPTVHIVDDDPDVRAALDGLFRSVGLGTRLHGSVTDFTQSKRTDGIACVVLDVRMPGVSGLDFQAELAASSQPLPIVVMTGHGDIPMTVRAMRAGAIDFLAKPFRDQDMLDAVARAFEQSRAAIARRSENAGVEQRFQSLTPREREVMALVTAGRMNKQIADDLKISEVTVKIHRGSVMRKMEVRSLADLVRASETLGLPRST